MLLIDDYFMTLIIFGGLLSRVIFRNVGLTSLMVGSVHITTKQARLDQLTLFHVFAINEAQGGWSIFVAIASMLNLTQL